MVYYGRVGVWYDWGMAEILLVRHAKSYANARDLAFGNEEAPLNEEGEKQIEGLIREFRDGYGIDPKTYDEAVLSSTFERPYHTASLAGFKNIERNELINEGELPLELRMQRGAVLEKHSRERWVPDELRARSQRFINLIRRGELEYEIFFTHGLFVASVLLDLSDEYAARGEAFAHVFDQKRGFAPILATITPVIL